MNAADILKTLRACKPLPIVREVVINDPRWDSIYRRHQLDMWPDIYGPRFEALGMEVADSVPAGFDFKNRTRRIDGLMLGPAEKTTAIEIKVTRADFRRDTDEKRRPWREVTHNFVYATPPGLVTPEEVPEGCGLWEVDPEEFHRYRRVTSVVKPKRNKDAKPIPDQVWRAMFHRVSAYEARTG